MRVTGGDAKSGLYRHAHARTRNGGIGKTRHHTSPCCLGRRQSRVLGLPQTPLARLSRRQSISPPSPLPSDTP